MCEGAVAPVIDVLGTPVALRVEQAFVATLRAQWSRCLTLADPVHELDLRGFSDADSREYIAAWRATLQGLMQLVEQGSHAEASPRVNLHAAGLADGSGSVLAVVGASGSGKTTAAAVLGQQLGYVTDECVSIDCASLQVLAYPKPLSVVIDPSHPQTKTQRGPDELGLQRPPDDLRLGAVVFLCRSPGSTAPCLTEVPMGEALMELVPQVSGLARMATPLKALAELLERVGGAYRLDYGDIRDAAPLLRELLRSRPGRHESGRDGEVGHHHEPAGGTRPSSPRDPAGRSTVVVASNEDVVRRRWWVDAWETEDQLVVFDGQRPFLLQGLGRVLWLLLGPDQRSIVDVHRQVTSLLGARPDSRALVRDAISVLARAGLLDVLSVEAPADRNRGARASSATGAVA